MTGSEVFALQRQLVYSCGSFSFFLSEKCSRFSFFSSPECTHVWISYTSHHVRLQPGIALLRSTCMHLQFLTVNLCSYQGWWSIPSTESVRCSLKQSVFIWHLIFIFIINTTMNIYKTNDSIMKTQKAVPKSFPFKYLDKFNWRVLKTTREMGYTQDKTLLPLATANLGDSMTCDYCSSKQSIEMDWAVTLQLPSKQTLAFRVAVSHFCFWQNNFINK